MTCSPAFARVTGDHVGRAGDVDVYDLLPELRTRWAPASERTKQGVPSGARRSGG